MKMQKTIFASCLLMAAAAFAPSNASAQVAPGPGGGGALGGGGAHFAGGWVFMGCATGIILAAFDANSRQDRQLTAQEAWLCGIPYWFTLNEEPKKRRHRARHHRRVG